jgi:hypothetical protein
LRYIPKRHAGEAKSVAKRLQMGTYESAQFMKARILKASISDEATHALRSIERFFGGRAEAL